MHFVKLTSDLHVFPFNAGSGMAETAPAPADDRRASVLADYRKVLLQHKEADAKVRSSERLRQNT